MRLRVVSSVVGAVALVLALSLVDVRLGLGAAGIACLCFGLLTEVDGATDRPPPGT